MRFHGIVPALLTPFTADQQLDEAALRKLVENLIGHGVHGLFALGTNGEFFALSQEEKLHIAAIMVDATAGRVPVIVGTGAFATHEVVDMNKRMADIGVDGLSVITPYFNAVSERELIRHYEVIAEASSLPIMLYNIPAKTGMSIGIKAVAALSQHPMIKGIKDSAGNFDSLVQMMNYRSDDFAVFAGTDSLIFPSSTGTSWPAATAPSPPLPTRCRTWSWISGTASRQAITPVGARPGRTPGQHAVCLPRLIPERVDELPLPNRQTSGAWRRQPG